MIYKNKKFIYLGITAIPVSALIISFSLNFNQSNSANSRQSTTANTNTLTSTVSTYSINSTAKTANNKTISTNDISNKNETSQNEPASTLIAAANTNDTAAAASKSSPESDTRQPATIARGEESRTLKRTPSGELILEKGVTDDAVMKLQQNLQKLGYFDAEPTGYFGEITLTAVIKFQKHNSLTPDGQAGPDTVYRIEEAVNNPPPAESPAPVEPPAPPVQEAPPVAERTSQGDIQLLPWFGQVENIFSIGTVATVTDVDTGLSFRAKRTYGYNHSDTEALTTQDTEVLRQIAGGSWNWTRRAVIVEVAGYRIAASLTALPHAGRDDQPANVYVNDRSGDYGYGVNLDTVKENNMDGHFDIHFYGSKTHATNSIDSAHQQMIQKALNSGM